MTQEEKQSLLQGMFQGADLRGAQIIAVNEGEVYYQKYAAGAASATKSEEDVKHAIGKLMESRDEAGGYLMHDQEQWYAIFRVLSAFCGYPQKASDFSRTMENLGVTSMRVPCRYDSFRKIALHQLPQNVGLWHQYLKSADQYSLKQIVVAVKLMELLEIDQG